MKNLLCLVLLAALSVAGCTSDRGPDLLAALRAQCVAGNLAACKAAGMHPQVHSDDDAVRASVDAALQQAVAAGTAMLTASRPRSYAQINRIDEHR